MKDVTKATVMCDVLSVYSPELVQIQYQEDGSQKRAVQQYEVPYELYAHIEPHSKNA